jgi:hypothetical protein
MEKSWMTERQRQRRTCHRAGCSKHHYALMEVGVRIVFPRIGASLVLLVCGTFPGFAQTSGNARFDGPAELPRVYVNSSLSDTPAPGKSLLVKDAGELQSALETAHCGDRILLQAGARFTGNFKVPAKNCDDAHWIIVRTSADDSALPPEGTRITPCYAGVASLPGRPLYACSPPRNVMAKLVSTAKNGQPVTLEEGANHYRFLGLEITRESPGVVYNVILMKGQGTNHHLVFDRDWIHGTAQDETTRGVGLGTSTSVAVVDSYLTDFHCVAVTGTCVDAQAIVGGLGDYPMGPYKIVNNFLEASGESLLFGGGEATQNPQDIEIRRNHLFKPLTWMRGSEGFVGGESGKPFIVKNLFELKNAQRVLFEGNILENAWGGFSQTGFAILLTPKNQNNRCPICKTTDLTIRFCRVSHAANGMVIGTGLSDAGGAASGGARYSIHDVVFDDIDGKAYGGLGALFQITSTSPALRDVSIDHVTGFPPFALFLFGVDVDRAKIINFSFTNNLVGVGDNDIFSTGGGAKNCAFLPRRQGLAGVLKSCFASFTFTHNALVGSAGGWPGGNSTPRDPSAVHLQDFRQGKGGDYRLCTDKNTANCKKASPFRKVGSDGKDLGADLDAIKAATEGIE